MAIRSLRLISLSSTRRTRRPSDLGGAVPRVSWNVGLPVGAGITGSVVILANSLSSGRGCDVGKSGGGGVMVGVAGVGV